MSKADDNAKVIQELKTEVAELRQVLVELAQLKPRGTGRVGLAEARRTSLRARISEHADCEPGEPCRINDDDYCPRDWE